MTREALSLIAMTAAAMAQDAAPVLTARILEIHMDKVRPEKWKTYHQHEASAAGKCATIDYAKPYILLTAVTGGAEVWRIATWDGLAAIEASYRPHAGAQTIRSSARTTTTAVAVFREDLSGPQTIDLEKTRYFEVSIVETHPGRASQFEEARAILRAARSRSGAKDPNFVYEAVSGLNDGTFLVIRPMTRLSEAGTARPMLGQHYNYPMLDTEKVRLRVLLADSVRHSRSQLFLMRPSWNCPSVHVPEPLEYLWGVSR